MSSLERLATDVLREDVCYLKGSIGLQGRVPGICAHCSFHEALSFGSSDRGLAVAFEDEFPSALAPCHGQQCAWQEHGSCGQRGPDTSAERGRIESVLPSIMACALVRVIHVSHVDSQAASSWKAPCKRCSGRVFIRYGCFLLRSV